MLNPKVGEKVKELRLKNLLTQEDLAQKAGTTFATINRIENRITTPQETTLKCIAEALNVSTKELSE